MTEEEWNNDLRNAHPQAVFKADGISVNCTVCATYLLAKGLYIVPSQQRQTWCTTIVGAPSFC
jgi:hypothetical protein